MRSVEDVARLIIAFIIIVMCLVVFYKFMLATQESGRFLCKVAYVSASVVTMLPGAITPATFLASTYAGYQVSKTTYKVASKIMGKNKAALLSAGIFTVVEYLGYSTDQAIRSKFTDIVEKFLNLCDCDVQYVYEKGWGMCSDLKRWIRSDVYKKLEKEYGKCSSSNETWRKIYYQAVIARDAALTLFETMGVQTGLVHIHYVVVLKNESEAYPFDEKDLNCYLYALKYRGNDSISMLDVIPNIYTYTTDETEVGCGFLNLAKCLKLVENVAVGNSPMCKVVGKEVEKREKELVKCASGSYSNYNDYLKACGLQDKIYMSTKDYLQNTDNLTMLYIGYNGKDRIFIKKITVSYS